MSRKPMSITIHLPVGSPVAEIRTLKIALDEDLAEEFGLHQDRLAAPLNEAAIGTLEHYRRNRLLGEWLDRMDEERGPVDEALVAKYIDLLS